MNSLLRRPELAGTAVLVNEFGEIGLDHLLVEKLDDNTVLLNAGCLCCINPGALHRSAVKSVALLETESDRLEFLTVTTA